MTIIRNQKNSKRDDLQGIRGLAILSVLGFHFYPRQFPNGYLGVDQFFVLSGFLMCMLLTKSKKLPIFSFFTQFYIRRFKRILPLYFLVILCTVIALYTVFPTAAILQNQMSAGKALIFTSNRAHTEDEDYFEKLAVAMDLFTHTWSLSVEIQFYFIIPFIFLIGLQLKGASRYIYYACLSGLSFIFHATSPTSVAFNSVFARIWQFSVGMMAYFMADSQKRNTILYKSLGNMEKEAEKVLEDGRVMKREEGVGIIILVKHTVLIISMLVMLIPVELTPLPVRLFITIFTGILIVLDVEDAVLTSQFLIYIGDISYALYLIHWPIYAYAKLTYPGNTWILTSALIISILLAMLVHQTYERWYLRQSNNMIATLVIILFSSNAIFIYRDQIQENVDRTMNNTVSSDGKYPRFDGWTPNMTLDDAQKMNYHWNRYDINDPKLRESGCVHKFPNKNWCEYPGNGTEYKIAILGSSYARNHYKLIIQECRNRAKAFTTADVMGCEPIAAPHIPVDNGRAFAKTWSPTCANHLIMFVDFINTTQPDYAFIMSRFFAVAEPYNNGPDNLNNDTVYLEMKSQLKKMLPNIKKKLFILDSFPRIQTKEVAKIAEEMKKGNKKMEDINKSLYDPFHYERGRHRYAELVKNECGPKCELIDYVDAFWNKTMNAFQYFDSNGFTYFTSINHVSAHGLEHVRPIYNKICSGL
ncbi:hypothetical protein L3Y34_003717 [Caenorhabditis briggsae]|uniref:Acyl_transf_3 domain-containing protein n=1 Tax=Caenorhabditis briggsae TaxID=6238 RepID=A0AAE9D689_CAEBR|nr:hypothetical protein L3Y34_003717 [Caenorhabditis briggsae]